MVRENAAKRTATTSGSAFVLVDHATEHVTADDLARGPWRLRAGDRQRKRETTVRPGLVVVLHVLAEHLLGMSSGKDDHVVQAFPAHGPHPPLGERVRAGRPDRGCELLDQMRVLGSVRAFVVVA